MEPAAVPVPEPQPDPCPECGEQAVVRVDLPGQPAELAVRVSCTACGFVIQPTQEAG